MKKLFFLLLLISCNHKIVVPRDADSSLAAAIRNPIFVPIDTAFKEYPQPIYSYLDSCLIIKTHKKHDGICWLVGVIEFDSCGRVIGYGCTDSEVIDTEYHKCTPCDSIWYKRYFKEKNFIKYLNEKANSDSVNTDY